MEPGTPVGRWDTGDRTKLLSGEKTRKANVAGGKAATTPPRRKASQMKKKTVGDAPKKRKHTDVSPIKKERTRGSSQGFNHISKVGF